MYSYIVTYSYSYILLYIVIHSYLLTHFTLYLFAHHVMMIVHLMSLLFITLCRKFFPTFTIQSIKRKITT